MPRDSFAAVAKELETIVVSLDRIGFHHPERPALDAALADFMIESDVFRRLSHARRLMYEAWTATGESEEALERELGPLTYWGDGESARQEPTS